MGILSALLGDQNSKKVKALAPLVGRINALEEGVAARSDEELRAATDEFKKRLAAGETLDALLPEVFALVREAAKRTVGLRHFDVQLMGGVALHQKSVVEMRTGEGKTLVATLPAYLNALEGEGVHVVTVNDYLARRDAVWMGQVYAFLGMSVGVINTDGSYLYDPTHMEKDEERDEVGSFRVVYEFLRPSTRQEAYAADITYGTNNEFGFDYLRDNTALEPAQLRQRERHFAIVDETDSILIDEARTPLIISMPSADSENLYQTCAAVARSLVKDEDYTVDEKFRSIALLDSGIEKAEKALGVEDIYTDRGIKYVHHLETAVRAQALFHKDKEYVIRDGKIVIVDEFTGRLQPGRRWSEGLHQAIEAKEGVPVQKESRTAASITFQNYFRLYDKLSGMTGTALTSSEEFFKVYGLETVAIPTNKPIARADDNDLIFQTEKGKFTAIARRVKELQEKGQPVLVGTASIEKNEVLSGYLARQGITHEVLNAKNHEREGEIIAQAGERGKVTVATNLAGRGVDIKLGGALAESEAYEAVKALGGLFVLGTERHEARRIDNQLRGRAGRQGDPGETQFYVSLEDSLMRVFASETIKKFMGSLGVAEDEPIENKLITRSLESAQTRIEGFHFDARKNVLQYDDVLNTQRETVYARRRKMLTGSTDEVEAVLAEIVGGDEALSHTVDEKRAALGDEEFIRVLRRLILQTIDLFWIQHLEVMDYTRSSVNLRAYGQRDPLVEYKKEGLRLFREMQDSVDEHVRGLLPHITTGAFEREQAELRKQQSQLQVAGGGTGSSEKPKARPIRSDEKVGRNDPCPCGSGLKYKKCGLIGAPEHRE